jgi:beta-glucosidase
MVALALTRSASAAQPPGPDPAVEAKVAALLAKMTLDEKIGQMVQADLAALKGHRDDIARLALGSVLSGGGSDPDDGNSPQAWAAAHDDCQARAMTSRLKVPLLFGVDAVHGHNNVLGAVIFPHNVGLGASRNASLVERTARVAAREIAATGIRWTFAPCVAVARNERWGRTYESFSENPEIVAPLGAAAVRGFQGDRLIDDPVSVLACAKHYLGDGNTTNGVDQGLTEGDESALRALTLPAYEAAIRAGVGSVMVSYSSWNGTKMHAQKELITGVLKGKLGFDGLVVSDWAAIDQIDPDYKVCVERSINAGLDLVMIPYGPGQKNSYVDFIGHLKSLVADGVVPMERIDDAVRRILRIKARMGILETAPHSSPELIAKIGSAEHRQVARAAVAASQVLLKNEKKALPISNSIGRLLVVGPAADDLGVQCGGWTIDWQGKAGAVTPGGTTILAAIRNACGPGVNLTYSADAGDRAKNAGDTVTVVVGEPPYAEMKGDRADLSLPASDIELIRKARAGNPGKPLVLVLLSGRPVVLGPALDLADAVIASWLPGTEGDGVADVLFGAVAPTAKLPHTWPRSMEQVPINVGEPMKGEPLFPLGFGLSY